MLIRLTDVFVAVIVSLLIATTSPACRNAFTSSQLVGEWIAEYEGGIEHLTLRADGRYVQLIDLRDRETRHTLTNEGTWTFEPEWNHVIFETFLFVSDGFGHLVRDRFELRGHAELPLETEYLWSGRLVIGLAKGSPYVQQ